MFRSSVLVLSIAALVAGFPAVAAVTQESPTPPTSTSTPRSGIDGESRGQMLERLQLTEDPGLDPDPDTVWPRGEGFYQIHKYPLARASFGEQEQGWIRPMGAVNASREIYQLDNNDVWVFEQVEVIDGQVVPFAQAQARRARMEREQKGLTARQATDIQTNRWTEERLGYARQLRPDFFPLTPASSGRTVRFRESSEGLPDSGSWRNSGAIADMNQDGNPDLVLPPPRGSRINGVPVIFLGDGTGKWEPWLDVSFPAPTNYGNVAVGDLNKDGYLDIVSGVHLTGISIFLGGKDGYFSDATPTLVRQFNTRRTVILDLNGDGHLDVAAVSEGPTLFQARGTSSIDHSTVIGLINDGTGKNWTQIEIAEKGRQTGGDWMVAGNFNGDRRDDLASGSIYFNGPDLMYLSEGENDWKAFGRGWMPFFSYYGGVTAGNFVKGTKTDEVVFSYGRTWPQGSPLEDPELSVVSGLELVSWNAEGEPTRTPIIRMDSKQAIWGVASGDFDGDGNLDVIYAQPEPREFVMLLGDGKGGFRTAEVSGLDFASNALYDITVGDVNKDGRPDLMLLYEKESDVEGSVRVYLNEGRGR